MVCEVHGGSLSPKSKFWGSMGLEAPVRTCLLLMTKIGKERLGPDLQRRIGGTGKGTDGGGERARAAGRRPLTWGRPTSAPQLVFWVVFLSVSSAHCLKLPFPSLPTASHRRVPLLSAALTGAHSWLCSSM